MVILIILLIYVQGIISELKGKIRKIICEWPIEGFRCQQKQVFNKVFLPYLARSLGPWILKHISGN